MLLAMLVLIAVPDLIVRRQARRTMVFFSLDNDKAIVSERVLVLTGSREMDVRRYIEEVILGPASFEQAPLLDRNSVLESLILRGNLLLVSFSQDAAIPPAEGGNVLDNLAVLNNEIKRNFHFIKDIRIFIAGNEIFKKSDEPISRILF